MIDEYLNIYEYEEMLMGKISKFKCSLQKEENTLEENRREAGRIWRYAIVNILHWTPDEAVRYLNYDIVKMLHLDKTFDAIGFVKTNNFNPDFRFALQYAFPEEKSCQLDLRKQALTEYNRVAKLGEWASDPVSYKYPKKFFIGESGMKRASYLMQHVVNTYLKGAMDRYEIYAFFANYNEAKRWLIQKSLGSPVTIMYNTPLDYFHFSMTGDEQDDVLYHIHVINELYKSEVKKTAIKQKKKKKKV